MRRIGMLATLIAFPLAVLATGQHAASTDHDGRDDIEEAVVHTDVVAIGIPGAGAIAQIGTFHEGGPFNDRADFDPAAMSSR
jgi:hypothetical protein